MAKKRLARPTVKASRITTISKGFRIRTYELPPPGFNPLTAAPSLLLRYGFPTRPDAKTAPELRKRWEAAFSRPRTLITPEFHEVKGKYHGPAKRIGKRGHRKPGFFNIANATSTNWSGSVASPPLGHTFGWIQGQWTVPNPQAPGSGEFFASEWVGIDGAGSNDVLQAGTETDIFNIFFNARAIYAWWEWFPANEVAITNLPVSAGDTMYCLICGHSTNATVYMSNESTGVWTRFGITAPKGTTLVGNSAEWIVERPTVNGSITSLADYKVEYFDEGIAGLSDVFRIVTLGSGTPVTMTGNNNAPLSVPTLETDQLMKVNWLKAN
jgi:hypothetical protein